MVTKTYDKKKLLVFGIRDTNSVIKNYTTKQWKKPNTLIESQFHYMFPIIEERKMCLGCTEKCLILKKHGNVNSN